MSYAIEARYTTAGAMTNAEAIRYYGRNRTVDELVDHWWGLPSQRARSPENILQYMLGAGKSVNYILGWDDYQGRVRILGMTPLDGYVAITTQNANIFSVSVECDPLITTSDPRAYELYKALGWLHWQLEGRYNKRLRAGVHLQYWSTQCSPIDKNRVLHEADKWRNGAYNPQPPAPTPTPTPPEGASIKYDRLAPNDKPKIYRFKRDANLWNFNHKRHADMNVITTFKAGDTISIVGKATNNSVGGSVYLMTAYSFGDAAEDGQCAFTNGVNQADVDLIVTDNPPAVEPPKPPAPAPEPEKPTIIYKKYDEPKHMLPKLDQVTLWDFNHAKHVDMKPAGTVKRDTLAPIKIVGYALHPTGSRYEMTAFSYDNSGKDKVPFKTNGFNTVDLEDVPKPPVPVPPQPPVEPTPDPVPLPPSQDSEVIINKDLLTAFIQAIIKLCQDFLDKVLKKG